MSRMCYVLSTVERCKGVWELKQAHSLPVTWGLCGNRLAISSSLDSSSRPTLGGSMSICWARPIVSQMDNPMVCQFNSKIKSLVSMHAYEDALKVYGSMLREGLQPDNYTFPCILKAIVGLQDQVLGQKIHAQVVKLGLGVDIYTCNTLIVMYASFNGWTEQARQLFDEMPRRSTVSWTVMITGYSKVGEVHAARLIFDEANGKDVVLWGAMISCYVHNSCFKEALQLFRSMQESGTEPDEAVLVSVLVACAHLGALDLGRWIHGYVGRKGMKLSIRLGTALLDMYGKCGSLDASQRVFEDMPQRDVVCWNSMIMALAVHGDADGALKLFARMEEYVLRPDDITFVAVLTACSHGGLVDEGRRQFERMSRIYGIQHKTEHYTCMVDVLSRAGFVDEARKLLQSIPVCNTGEALAWRALLSASWHYRNVESAEFAAERLLQLEPHSGVYSLLSNIYAATGKFDESQKIKKLMKERGVQKTPGCSSIVLDGFVHEFVAGEKAHPEIEEIYTKWEDIKKELMVFGYKADVSSVTFDLEEEEKEYSVHHHSEKLAIAYAFMKLEPDIPIRVMKNLRVCRDCHNVIKLITRVFNRQIIVRDRSRFHHFSGGSCSCHDYW
ncbi:pentatricopeptide repeat-containing protein At5g06540-like [Nymphaea colorata]|uniref:DYW domain-containing protein n=1 Tax=Nymphaea colorata TaxID=210225 RepID=A0A5K1GK38_9MAGN|nr:pentatricopeptide repeat-containing protein At5g06540-like [Nymphaea colorata]